MNAMRKIEAAPIAPVDRRGDSLLRIAEAKARTGLSVATIYRRCDAGTFPTKVAIGPRSIGFYQTDIDAFVANPAGYRATPIDSE